MAVTRVLRSSILHPLSSILYLLSSLLLLAAGPATTQTTRPATTEPWRPSPDHPKSISILLSPGIAPCVLHVNALHFPLQHGTPLSARYVWDFGDPAGRYNQLPGFNAGHIYNAPGKYTITLWVTDETGQMDSAVATVTILPNHRHVLFIAPNGADGNIGTNPESPLHSLGKALALKNLPDDTEILLRAGGTYFADSTLKINKSDMHISRYDEGPDPILLLSKQEGAKPPHGFISIDGRCNGVLIEHLTFDSPYGVLDTQEAPKIGIDAIVARGRNITIRDCTFLNVDSGINANGSPAGLMVENCKAPKKTGLRAYLCWVQGSDFVCLGNSAANSTREHIVRLSGVSRALIAVNDFTNLDRRPADKYDYSKGTIEMHNGSYAWIAHNTVTDGTIRVGPLGINGEPPTTATDWSVIECNTLNHTSVLAYPGSHHVMIRNNIFHGDNVKAIELQAPDEDGRHNGDIHILNNTAINNGTGGMFLKVWGHTEGIELKNNLFIAPNLKPGVNGAAVVNLAEGDLSSFSAIGHNLWPDVGSGASFLLGGRPVTFAAWTAMPGVTSDIATNVVVDAKARPVDAQAVVGKGEALPAVCFDEAGHRRGSHPSVGAIEMSPAATEPATAGNK
jgi:PKD repeat protein